MEVTFSPLKGSLKTPKKVTGKNLEYGPGKKWWQKTQCKNATAKHLQDAAGKKALSLALCLLDTYKNMYIYIIYIYFRCLLPKSLILHSCLSLLLTPRDLYLASAPRYQLRQSRVQQGPLPCHLPVRQASRCHHWKTIGSCILRGWDATFAWWCSFRWIGWGWSSCLCQWTTRWFHQ